MRSSNSPCVIVPADLSKASWKRLFCSFTWLGDKFSLVHDKLYHHSTFKVIKQQNFKCLLWLFLAFGIASRFVVNPAHEQVRVADLAFFFLLVVFALYSYTVKHFSNVSRRKSKITKWVNYIWSVLLIGITKMKYTGKIAWKHQNKIS